MKDLKAENVIGALALTVSDMVLNVTGIEAPSNISAAGLTLIGHVPGISINELSHGLCLSHPGTVRLVDRMEAEGLVRRDRSTNDGRAVALHLTAAGKEREGEILSSRRTVLSKLLALLSNEEHAALAQISQKLLTAILKDEDHALRICRLCDSAACTQCPVDAELLRKSTASDHKAD